MRALWGVALVGVVALTACGDSSAEPRVLPSLSAPASPSPSPIPTGPAAAHDAAEFVKFFYAEISRGFAERDPEIVSALSLPTCKTCKLYVDSIRQLREQNQRLVGGGFKITLAVAPADTAETARVDLMYDFPASRIVDGDGRTVETNPAMSKVEEQVALTRVDTAWRVASIKRVVHK
jgi:hypothetical protein